MKCAKCQHLEISKGRAVDGRRAYRCEFCGHIWTNGLQGRSPSYKPQRKGFQFAKRG